VDEIMAMECGNLSHPIFWAFTFRIWSCNQCCRLRDSRASTSIGAQPLAVAIVADSLHTPTFKIQSREARVELLGKRELVRTRVRFV